MPALLLALLALDCLQLLVGVLAIVRSNKSRRAGAPSHARYSLEHGLLLLGGGFVLLVPIVLGLTGVIGKASALYAAIALEIVALPVAQMALRRFETAHLARRPA
jgi:hypothetical protein